MDQGRMEPCTFFKFNENKNFSPLKINGQTKTLYIN